MAIGGFTMMGIGPGSTIEQLTLSGLQTSAAPVGGAVVSRKALLGVGVLLNALGVLRG